MTGSVWKKRLKKGGLYIAGAVVVFFLLDLLVPVNGTLTYAPVVEARDGTVLHAWLTADQQWRIKTGLKEITPELKQAIVYKEDKHFYHHPGINALAVGRAIVNNVFHLRRTSGASTITMQVARMLEPKPRTYIGKCIEMFRALQLEVHYSKDEILQLYLNLVPYGSNIQGVKAAALLYFGKTPDQLSLAEITALSIIPNRPNSLVIGKDNNRIVRERNKWLVRFREEKVFSQAVIADAIAEPLTAYRHNAPGDLPQFAWRMRRSHPTLPVVRSTIDRKVQQQTENIVTNYLNELKLHNINNAAVLVTDNITHEVIAYIGSGDFADRAHFGQVDGVRAIRSPGSTLKPLLYGMAFDKGLATPKTVTADVPINIRGYTPENYDKTFKGNVTIEYALCNSLNIPAVNALEAVGKDTFVSRLAGIGFTSIGEKQKKLGLSVILGGCGVRLEELTALYATFANGGLYQPLAYTLQEKSSGKKKEATDKRILSDASAYMLTQVLSELHRPDLPNACDIAQGVPRIAWKTGTSYGRKDAWSIGYNKRYTIGVWLGNFSGQGVPELSGANTATPLLFRLFNTIDHHAANEWLEPPASLSFRLVCSESGKVPNEFCHNQIMDHYIPGISRNDQCDHLKETWISADERISYCTSCLPPNGYKTRLMPQISAELAAYYESNHTPYTKVPAHNPACSRMFEGRPPVITSLTNGMTYLVVDKEQQKLQLACATGVDVQKVYWYINNRHIATSQRGEKVFFAATTPNVRISCTDDKGRTTSIQVKVKFI